MSTTSDNTGPNPVPPDPTLGEEETVWVTLYCTQAAEVPVRAARGTSRDTLRELALRGLDASGGAEWVTRAGWVEHVAWTEAERIDPITEA
jgi:hypothetical protein